VAVKILPDPFATLAWFFIGMESMADFPPEFLDGPVGRRRLIVPIMRMTTLGVAQGRISA
jgi:hypothetical protein